MAISGGGRPEVSLQIEDAQPDTIVNLLSNSVVWFVTKLKTSSSSYKDNVDVTLSVDTNKFQVGSVGTRHTDAEDVTQWSAPQALGGGRYRLNDVDLVKRSGEADYSLQVIFTATVKSSAAEGYAYISTDAYGPNWVTHLDDTAAARIYRNPPAWIITNRTRLFDYYDDSQVQLLLNETFEQAQGAGFNGNPTAVVFYVDRYEPSLTTWDNRNVNYASETTANAVADDVADWLTSRIVRWHRAPGLGGWRPGRRGGAHRRGHGRRHAILFGKQCARPQLEHQPGGRCQRWPGLVAVRSRQRCPEYTQGQPGLCHERVAH